MRNVVSKTFMEAQSIAQNIKSDRKFIDLENVIRGKNPGLLKFLPGFVLNFIRKIIHENEINAFIQKNGHKYDFDFLASVLEEFKLKINVIGKENKNCEVSVKLVTSPRDVERCLTLNNDWIVVLG